MFQKPSKKTSKKNCLGSISIAIPSTTGGGAETFTGNFARWLESRGQLSKIYTSCKEVDFGHYNVQLGVSRAVRALIPFWRKSSGDPARAFLLTLGYINLSLAIRLRLRRARVVVRICNPPTEEIARMGAFSAFRYLVGAWLSCALADSIIVQSEHMRSSLKSLKLAPDRKLHKIPNPLPNLTKLDKTKVRHIEPSYILCAATNKPQKDIRTLIAAFSRIQQRTERHLVLAGIEHDDPQVLEWIQDNGADDSRIHRLGFVEDIYPLIFFSDLCVLPSRFEGFSNFLLEAGAYGKLIVATNCPGGNTEFFSRYTNRKIVEVGDVDGMSLALLTARNDLDRERAVMLLSDFNRSKIYEAYKQVLLEYR